MHKPIRVPPLKTGHGTKRNYIRYNALPNIAEIQTGDLRVFSRLFSGLVTRITKYLERRIEDPEVRNTFVLDATTDICAKIWKLKAKFHPVHNPLRYRYLVVTALSNQQEITKADHYFFNASVTFVPDENAFPMVPLRQDDFRTEHLHRIIDQLPDYKKSVILRMLKGSGTQEIAVELGRTVERIRQVYQEALCDIRNRWQLAPRPLNAPPLKMPPLPEMTMVDRSPYLSPPS